MKITFGISLDSASYPPLTSSKDALLGEMRCGPLGLLQILETRLGLTGIWEAEPFRVEIYRQRLLAADNGNRFYSRSLEADALGVAQTLLSWRDELLLSGWDFVVDDSFPPRLRDLAAVESVPKSGAPAMPWGFSEQMRAVVAELPSARLDISEVCLLEAKGALGKLWESLTEKLSASGVTITYSNQLSGSASGDLGALQHALRSGDRMTAKGDGSLLILRGASDCELNDLISAWLVTSNKSERLFILPPGDRTLERVLASSGAPSLGITSYSSLRPILQLLPLLCELLWEPIDPYRLLELLTLPVTPIPRIAGRKLAEAVASSPGIGGKIWKAALKEIENDLLAVAADGKEKWAWTKASIDAWLDTKRYTLATGVPKEALADLAKRVAGWAGTKKLRDDADDSQLKALAAQAAHLARIAEGAPEICISQPQLRKLLQTVLGEGLAQGEAPGAGHLPWVTTPEAITATVQEIFWCGFTRGNSGGYRRSPWLKKEVSRLATLGITLSDPDLNLTRQVIGYERAVHAARSRLVLVIPEKENGSPTELHPLYDRLAVMMGKSIRTLEISSSQWLAGDKRLTAVATAPVTSRKVPVPARFWTLPVNVDIPRRVQESYSSLETVFESPYSWVLGYGAKLREGAIQSIGSKSSIMGNLSHRLFEELFVDGEDCRKWTQAVVEKKVAELLAQLLPTEGAVFLLPGHLSERQTIVRRLKRAAWALTEHIKDNGWRVKATEYDSQGMLGTQDVRGSVDLLLQKSDGSLAVVDLKWGLSKYLRPKLLENRAIQLALYAHMLKDKKRMPHVAYFSFSDAILVAPDRLAFKAARLAELPPGESLATLIAKMDKTFIFRRDQLDAGKIEVPVGGTLPLPGVTVPADILVDPENMSEPAEFRALIGWEDGNHA